MTFKPDVAPRRGKAAGEPKPDRPPRPSTRSLRRELEGLLTLINAPLSFLAPTDALDAVEIAALAKALDEQAKVNARFRRGIETILSAGGGSSLVIVAGTIVIRRVARHQLFGVPRMVDDLGGVAMQMMDVKPAEAADAMSTILTGFMGGTPSGPDAGNGSTPTGA